ncbi:MAG: HEAT repeat domain-containing protein [Planctomycetes bacterium]|nr:HEAT repeat domain-containing protein [Planctomycetota bacterium]
MSAPDTPPTDQISSSSPDSQIEYPENLPPVEPPSAGFIIQLFVVPALIVGAVIGVWLLFGSLATNDYNWEKQVNELRVENENRRWRAAFSLSQMLQADLKSGEQGANLKSNEQLAVQLVDVLNDQLTKASPSDKDLELRSFLIAALGLLDVDQVTLPVLVESLEPTKDLTTRENALTAIINIAGRDFEEGQSFHNEEVTAALLAASRDESPAIRQRAAFALGLIDADGVDQRLKVLLEDKDEYVRVNAAIALTRKKSTAGLDVLESILKQAGEEQSLLETVDRSDQEAVKQANAHEIEMLLMTKNSLKAVEELVPQLSNSEKERLTPLIKTIANDFREPSIKLAAEEVLQSLQQN